MVYNSLSQSPALKSLLQSKTGTINIKIEPTAEVQKLNKSYAGKDEPTDVLSFPYDNSDELGDVVISAGHIKSQATRAGTDEQTELVLLILHGVLHILGFDHQTASDQAKLDKIQSKLMRSLGLEYRNFHWE